MTFDEYQDFTSTTAKYPPNLAVPYTALGLAGEVGEVVEAAFRDLSVYLTNDDKAEELSVDEWDVILALDDFVAAAKELQAISKAVRGDPGKEMAGAELFSRANYDFDETNTKLYKKELSDVQWFVSEGARSVRAKLSDIAQINKTKLTDRLERGVIKGDGDER